MHNGEAQTAINTYRRMDGRTVTLVGILHMADADYYVQLRKRIDELEAAGAVVQYEKGKKVDDLELMAATDDERAAIEGLHASLELRFKPFEMLNMGWQSQAESPMDEIGPNWQLIDAGVLNVVRLFGPKAMLASNPVTGPEQQIAMIGKLEPGSFKYKAIRAVIRSKYINQWNKGHEKHLDDVISNVIYFYREAAFALAILGASQDVVSISGAPHLLTVGKILERNDFALISSEWVTAIGNEG